MAETYVQQIWNRSFCPFFHGIGSTCENGVVFLFSFKVKILFLTTFYTLFNIFFSSFLFLHYK